MGTRVVRFKDGNEARFGVVVENRVRVIPGAYDSLAGLLSNGRAAVQEAASASSGEEFLLEELQLLSPVTQPTRIICQGANYASHRLEAGMQPQRPGFNLIFTKSDTSLSGPTDDVIRPNRVRLLDYEIEVGLVIGKPVSAPANITGANFLDYVAGILIANDISARDVQLVEGQWFKGKSYRTFCPTGPFLYLLDEDEVSLIHDLELRLAVNGEVRQLANTSQLLFKPEETLSELSEIVNLEPGDLVLTGTPGGVALNLSSEDMANMSNPSLSSQAKMELLLNSQQGRLAYLNEGDEIVCEIKSSDGRIDLGIQRNRVVAAR